jgi:hypothetical protein
VVQFGECLFEEVLKAVTHRHFTFSLPKILRCYFLYGRIVLSDLSHCFCESLKTFLATVFPKLDAIIGAFIAIQTFDDCLNFHPRCDVLCTDGAFYGTGSFKVAPALDTEALEKLFQHKVLCCSKDGKNEKTFGAFEWLAAMGRLDPLRTFGKRRKRHASL